MADKLNIVLVCAHPDDCELSAGGLTARYLELGHKVTYIVTTNGNGGHYEMDRESLRLKRLEETKKVADFWGIEYVVMDNDDGKLEPTLAVREDLIRILRRYRPDVIITHGLDDYHPDHRYTAQLVADTAYMLNVPLCVPDAPVVRKDVVYCHISTKPQPDSNATVLVPVEKYLDKKIQSVHMHDSQIYQWLPWTEGLDPADVPSDEAGRIEFLKNRWMPEWQQVYKNYYPYLAKHCDLEHGDHCTYYEAFVASLWGCPLTCVNAKKYFPFKDAIVF